MEDCQKQQLCWGSACIWYGPLLGCCCLSKAALTSSFALRMDKNGTSLESSPQGSGIPAGDRLLRRQDRLLNEITPNI